MSLNRHHSRYPVVYLLHGSMVDETFWSTEVEIKPMFDRLIAEGKIPPSIVVMPGSKSWWVDGCNEAAETAFFKDFIPHIEAKWQVANTRGGRIISGISAGGYGALSFALKYPSWFAASAAFSPASYEDLPPKRSSAYRHPAYLNQQNLFDEEKWRQLNYPAFIDSYMAQDTIVPMHISSGDHDALDIAYHSAVFYQKLRNHQPAGIELRIVDGDHEKAVWKSTIPEAMEYVFQYIDSSFATAKTRSDTSQFKNDESAVKKILLDLDNTSLTTEQQLQNYLSNAVILAPQQKEIRGTKALHAHLTEFKKNTNLKINHQIIELESFGEVVVLQGKVLGRVYSPESENYSNFETKNVIIFKRDDSNALKISKVIYNLAPAS